MIYLNRYFHKNVVVGLLWLHKERCYNSRKSIRLLPP